MADTIEREDRGDVTVLSVPARLDTVLSDSLQDLCDELAGAGRFKVVLDCRNLEFINSIVIEILLGFRRRSIMNGGDLKLADVSVPLEDILHLTQLDRVFACYPSVQQAIASF